MTHFAWWKITEESWNGTEGIRLFPCNKCFAETDNTLQFLCIPTYAFIFETGSHRSCNANPAHVERSSRQSLFSVTFTDFSDEIFDEFCRTWIEIVFAGIW